MSDNNTKTVWKAFFAWNEGKEEGWLRAQALSGWHLVSVGLFFYRLRRGEPADVTYRLDLQTTGKFDRSEYLSLFGDAGWEHVCGFGAWHYFRTPTGSGRSPEIYTDIPSRVAKYQRLFLLLIILTLPLFTNLLHPLNRRFHSALWTGFRAFQAAVLVFLVYGAVRLAILISKLKKSSLGTGKI